MDETIPDLLANQSVLQGLALLIVMLCAFTIAGTLKNNQKRSHNIKALQKRVQLLRQHALSPVRPESKNTGWIRALMIKLNIKTEDKGQTGVKLAEAGFHSPDAPYVMAFYSLILPVALGLAAIVLVYTLHPPAGGTSRLLNYTAILFAVYFGLKLPAWYVARTRKKRYRRIKKALPDMLDLLTISVEAGLSLGAAMEGIYGELGLAHPELAEELNITSAESKFLSDRNKALANWAERCKISEVRGIVSVLIQTEKFGTPIVQALRSLSSEFRQERMLAAEHKAMKLPVQMTIPMMLCIMPTIVIIILAPAIMKLMDAFHQYVITH